MKKNYFILNGNFRLLMAILLCEEYYSKYENHLILIKGSRDNYDELLSYNHNFKTIKEIKQHSSIKDKIRQSYFPKKTFLSEIKNANIVLFSIGGQVPQEIFRFSKKNNNYVEVYSESIGVYSFFAKPTYKNFIHKIIKNTFKKLFFYEHKYDVFYVYDTTPYKDTEFISKMKKMPDLFTTKTFNSIAKFYEHKINLVKLKTYNKIFFGQPLSNNEGILPRNIEQKMLQEIIGKQKILVLLHPLEIINKNNNKYEKLKNIYTYKSPIPSEILLHILKPKETYTYYSTLGITNSLINKTSKNFMYPVHLQLYTNLKKQEHTFNIVVSKKYIHDNHHKTQ